jgi:hypothetical protein
MSNNIEILAYRANGTFVIKQNGVPYHVEKNDPLFDEINSSYEDTLDENTLDENTVHFLDANGVYLGEMPFYVKQDGWSVIDAAPVELPIDKIINRVQFKSMLALLGKSTDDVMAAIDAVITDPTQNTIAKVKVTDSDRYARNNELFTILAPSLNLTDAAIDAAWEQAILI